MPASHGSRTRRSGAPFVIGRKMTLRGHDSASESHKSPGSSFPRRRESKGAGIGGHFHNLVRRPQPARAMVRKWSPQSSLRNSKASPIPRYGAGIQKAGIGGHSQTLVCRPQPASAIGTKACPGPRSGIASRKTQVRRKAVATFVIPAKAGIQRGGGLAAIFIPWCAGSSRDE